MEIYILDFSAGGKAVCALVFTNTVSTQYFNKLNDDRF
jgi:hypothetical protein